MTGSGSSSGSGSDQDGADRDADAEPAEAERRRRRARVFGEVLPDVTGDERGDGGDRGDEAAGEEWLRRQVPPHHG